MELIEAIKSGKPFIRPCFNRWHTGDEPWLTDNGRITFKNGHYWNPRLEDLEACDWIIEDDQIVVNRQHLIDSIDHAVENHFKDGSAILKDALFREIAINRDIPF